MCFESAQTIKVRLRVHACIDARGESKGRASATPGRKESPKRLQEKTRRRK